LRKSSYIFFLGICLLVNKVWDLVKLSNVESYAGCFLAAVLCNEGFQTVFSATDGCDFEALGGVVVGHGFTNTTGGSDYQDVFVWERHGDYSVCMANLCLIVGIQPVGVRICFILYTFILYNILTDLTELSPDDISISPNMYTGVQ
jgi:hypothetical protein